MTDKTIRIASGSGFWGDWLEAPASQLRAGPIDYLVLDYLAELTMSILVRQQLKNPERGYAHDFVTTIELLLDQLAAKGVKIVANAGGVNPAGCAKAVKAAAAKHGIDIPVAYVDGDNLLDKFDSIIADGWRFNNLDTGEPIDAIRDKVLSANAYIGSEPIAEALSRGAKIVVTGRVADASLAVGPLLYEFGTAFRELDALALATVAGHIIECGAQASGGNLSIDWETVPDPARIGFPILEAAGPGEIVITKHEDLGGRVDLRTVKEQLVYEIGDPRAYITPDVVADFSAVELREAGPNRVAVSGAKGSPATEFYKVSIAYSAGYKAESTLVYSWPDAAKKAVRAGDIVRRRLEDLGLKFEAILIELLGAGACHAGMVPAASTDLPEVVLRIAVRDSKKEHVERFTRELTPLVLGGPPGATGYTGPRPQVHEVYGYWPALVPKTYLNPRVSLL